MQTAGTHDVSRPRLQHWVEYLAIRCLVAGLAALPRSATRALGAGLGWLVFHLHTRLREAGLINLRIAYPEWDEPARLATLKQSYRHLGWQLAEFCHMPGYTLANTAGYIRYEGLEHLLAARDRGRGVLVLTGHLGAWELSSFYHSLAGYPMGMVIRRLDNPLLDAYVNRIRCLHGNRVLHKDDFARGLISAMRAGETVGILMDTNMTPPQGVFVPFFGKSACTASGMARIARKTGAAVLPGYLVWDAATHSYVLHFGAALKLINSGDAEQDALENTALFTAVLEASIRAHPEQWLWMHRRWKTRPPGEGKVYP